MLGLGHVNFYKIIFYFYGIISYIVLFFKIIEAADRFVYYICHDTTSPAVIPHDILLNFFSFLDFLFAREYKPRCLKISNEKFGTFFLIKG